jgi:hypothetical protein
MVEVWAAYRLSTGLRRSQTPTTGAAPAGPADFVPVRCGVDKWRISEVVASLISRFPKAVLIVAVHIGSDSTYLGMMSARRSKNQEIWCLSRPGLLGPILTRGI